MRKGRTEHVTKQANNKTAKKMIYKGGTAEQLLRIITTDNLNIGCISADKYETLTSTWILVAGTHIIHSETTQIDISRRRANHRGYALGILNAIKFLQQTLWKYHMPNSIRGLSVWTDNSKINAIMRRGRKFTTPQQLIDNESEMIRHLKYNIRQFGKITINPLSKNAKPNTIKYIMYQLCQNQHSTKQPITVETIWQQRATLLCRGKEVSHGVTATLREAAGSQDLRDYLQTKYEWNDETMETIDWDIHEEALMKLTKREMPATM